MTFSKNPHIAVLGQGYVGLPLSVGFSKHYRVTAFDINPQRIAELKQGRDRSGEVSSEELATAKLVFATDPSDIADCDVYIVTVPTPIDKSKLPDLTPLLRVSEMIGTVLKPGNVVIYESTVYPGCTEEECIPILERVSGLRYNADFYCGYSPERINPGDREHRFENTIKITSGSTVETAEFVDSMYRAVISAGTYPASSIRVAEAAKVIENVQRDMNIALMNVLAMIFHLLGIDTIDVLEAAGSKWNFLPFRPGLVGGHCIGVDPYYLTHKAQQAGYLPQMILSGRQLNDNMGKYIANRVMRMMTERRIHVVEANILLLGLAFKENCPDLRNTRVVDIYRELKNCNANVEVYDPVVDADETQREYGIELIDKLEPGRYDTIILCVAHREFIEMSADAIHELGKSEHVLFDVKAALPAEVVDARL